MTRNLRGSILITLLCRASAYTSTLVLRKTFVCRIRRRILTSVCDPIKLRGFRFSFGFQRPGPRLMRKIAGCKGRSPAVVRASRRGIAFTQANRESSCLVGVERKQIAEVPCRFLFDEDAAKHCVAEDIDRSIDDDGGPRRSWENAQGTSLVSVSANSFASPVENTNDLLATMPVCVR